MSPAAYILSITINASILQLGHLTVSNNTSNIPANFAAIPPASFHNNPDKCEFIVEHPNHYLRPQSQTATCTTFIPLITSSYVTPAAYILSITINASILLL